MTERLLKHVTSFFVNIVPSLNILPKKSYEEELGNDNQLNLNHINTSRNHLSIKLTESPKRKGKLLLLIMFLMKIILTKSRTY